MAESKFKFHADAGYRSMDGSEWRTKCGLMIPFEKVITIERFENSDVYAPDRCLRCLRAVAAIPPAARSIGGNQ